MGTLYIVATPIGNLKDITLRALEVLKSSDLILAEDTRVAKKLLGHYGILTPVRRYDEHIGPRIHEEVINLVSNGKSIALVSDAGTPGIADPGQRLVEFLRSRIPEIRIIPVPGPTALASVLSVSGLNTNQFTFLGYPPHKKGRQTFFRELKDMAVRPVVFYESPHRINKTLASLSLVFGPNFEILVGRELTKIYEEIWKGRLKDAAEHFTGERKKGEFVLIIP
ncbi:MAG TPA: 16S rRNA (cytidine(1402)-2'-O)-methyltransferase [Candidatus Paceibacterota bacterium]|nr:16S rRNA (cytidine(1402)-2'-O)-methyltransferase [Candidatus Paceibacterota bacterium]